MMILIKAPYQNSCVCAFRESLFKNYQRDLHNTHCYVYVIWDSENSEGLFLFGRETKAHNQERDAQEVHEDRDKDQEKIYGVFLPVYLG